MLKEAIQYLVSLKDNNTYDINGDIYSDKELVRIAPHIDRPAKITVNGLDSIVKLIRNEIDVIEFQPIFIRVENARTVSVFTTYDDTMTRDSLYAACCDVPEFKAGTRPHEQVIIELRSKFIENEGSLYLLDLLSSISKEQGVTSADNGVSQDVTAKSGIALSQKVRVKPRVALRPYRTFLEIEQPESEFLLRLTDDGDVSLYEADGGMWVMEAKGSIALYFQQQLSDLVEAGKVVVMV